MCEFCVRHGDGRRWYLNAANYAAELLHDTRRQRYIRDFIPGVTRYARRWLRIMDLGNLVAPRLTARLARERSTRMKEIHFGQVVPLEDVAAVMAVAGQVVRLPCVCREVLQGRSEGVCYLVAASPAKLGLTELVGSRREAASFVAGMEGVDPAAALAHLGSLEGRGMVHTVWTFISPFIGAVCNCDPAGCLAMNFTRRGLSLYFPGEWRAAVDDTLCTACGECAASCHFGALTADGGPARVDHRRCHGCGICRRSCPAGALTLHLVAGPQAAGDG